MELKLENYLINKSFNKTISKQNLYSRFRHVKLCGCLCPVAASSSRCASGRSFETEKVVKLLYGTSVPFFIDGYETTTRRVGNSIRAIHGGGVLAAPVGSLLGRTPH